MKKRCVIDGRWLMAALVIMLGLVAHPWPAAAGHIACGAVLGPGGTYTLDSDILDCPASRVLTVISATLNLNGHTV
jgi:hypothetical protein